MKLTMLHLLSLFSFFKKHQASSSILLCYALSCRDGEADTKCAQTGLVSRLSKKQEHSLFPLQYLRTGSQFFHRENLCNKHVRTIFTGLEQLNIQLQKDQE